MSGVSFWPDRLQLVSTDSRARYRAIPDDRGAIGLLHHRRTRATLRTRLSAEAVLERLISDPRLRQADRDPMPWPPPPEGAPLLWTRAVRRGTRVQIQIRDYEGFAHPSGPITELSFEAEAETTLIHLELCPNWVPWGPTPPTGPPRSPHWMAIEWLLRPRIWC